MERFAKVYDLNEGQVLVTSTYNDDEDVYDLTSTTVIDGVQVSIRASFEDGERCKDAFNNHTFSQAFEFYKMSAELFDKEVEG